MATENILALVKCPFFLQLRRRRNQRLEIVCEGIVDGTTLTTAWKDEQKLKNHLEVCCCNQYMDCEVCKILWSKYE